METKKGKTVFVEYSSYEKGQHFMTVVQTKDHKRIIIGRIYKVYDKENKKTKYLATDFAGNQIFKDTNELTTLKQKFIENGQNLVMLVPSLPSKTRQSNGLVFSQKAERKQDLEKIRDKKSSKEKTREVPKTNLNAKNINDQKEKELDSKSNEKYKDLEQGKDEINPKENLQEKSEPDSEKPIQEEPTEPEKSERDIELEDIRDQNEDRGDDLER